MRRLIVSTFASFDGIMQAPGRPEEYPTGGFTLGGWMFGYADESMDISASGFDGKDREVVLGRRTYEIFEAYWPYVKRTVRSGFLCHFPMICGKLPSNVFHKRRN